MIETGGVAVIGTGGVAVIETEAAVEEVLLLV